MSHIVVDARHRRSSTGRYVDRILNGLQTIDAENHYTVLLHPEDEWRPSSSRFRSQPAPFADYSAGEQMGLLRLLHWLRPDLVHFTMPQQPLLHRGRTVTTVHDLTLVHWRNYDGNRVAYELKRQVFVQLLKRVARRSTALIAPSIHTQRDLARFAGIAADRIRVIYEAGDSLPAQPDRPRNFTDEPYVLYVGNAFPYKNLERLLLAWPTVRMAHPATQLVLVGRRSSFYDALRAQAPFGVTFLHDVEDQHLRWLYEHARFLVFPSLSEGFGLPGLEAMGHGCPVLASDATCLPEVYGTAAAYFDPYDVEAIARALSDNLSDSHRRQALVEAGLERVGRYSWVQAAKETLEVYEAALRCG